MNGSERDTQRELPSLQWFPGHMKKAQRLIEENLKLVDVVVELRDARIPAASANPMLAEIIQGKPRVIALNKSDLADPAATKAWLAYFRAQGIRAVAIDANKGKGMKQLTQAAEELARPKTEKYAKSGGRGRAARSIFLALRTQVDTFCITIVGTDAVVVLVVAATHGEGVLHGNSCAAHRVKPIDIAAKVNTCVAPSETDVTIILRTHHVEFFLDNIKRHHT